MPSTPTIELGADLYIIAFFTFFACFLILRLFLSSFTSLIIASLKTLIPFLYFGFFFSGEWLLLDDVSYWQSGLSLLKSDLNPLTIFSSKGLPLLFWESGGFHIFYPLYNFLAQYFFGPHYFSPVFWNVIVSVIAGYFMFQLMIELGFEKARSKFVSVFFMFDAQVLAWSSFLNLKDVCVMMLTISSLYFLLRLLKRFSWRDALAMAVLFALWVGLRFYIPILLIAAAITYSMMSLRLRHLILIITAGVAMGFYMARHSNIFAVLEPAEFGIGVIHYLIGPIPWQVEDNYSFLTLPAWIHWILFPLAVLGFIKSWKTNPRSRLILIYFVLVVLAFAITPEVRGARHRLQLMPIFAWLQYSFLWDLLPRKAVQESAPQPSA
jgi:hypothetical protein